MKKILFIALISNFILVSCKNDEYQTHNSNLKYKYIIHNSKSNKPQIGDLLKTSLIIKTTNDSVIYNGKLDIILSQPTHNGGSVDDGLALLNVGDSAHFIVQTDSFYLKTLKRTKPDIDSKTYDKIIFEVGLTDYITEEALKEQIKQTQQEMAALEDELLTDFIKRENINTEPQNSGLYFIVQKSGNGKKPKHGQIVEVHYKGSLINGQPFDSSYNRNESFSFTLGNGSVIQGWEEGIAMMDEGCKAMLIIPSHLAYGSESKANIIPPYSTLIFEIELLKIK